jgi:general secretion pathway protein M
VNPLERLRAWLDTLAERERRMVVWGGIGGAVVLFIGLLVVPLYAAAGKAGDRVAQKRDDLAWMRSVAPEVRAAGPIQANGGGESMVVTVDQTARAAGLGSFLSGSQPSGTGGIRVQFSNAPFDLLVGWFAQLQQQQGLVVDSATIDRSGAPGSVNANVILRKAG